MTTMKVVGECFFWYRLTRVFPDKFHRAVKRLCVCVLLILHNYSHRVCKPANLVPVPSQEKWEGCARRGIQRKNGGMAEIGAPISLDRVAVHPDCWCVCLCYLHFAQENPEDGETYLLVPAHPGCPGQNPESCKMTVCVRVCVCSHLRSKQRKNRGGLPNQVYLENSC